MPDATQWAVFRAGNRHVCRMAYCASSVTCRKYYVHPAIVDAYMDGSLFPTMQQRAKQDTNNSPHALSSEERAVLKLLEQHLVQDSQKKSEK